jgi:high affinity Mn2+ porin
VRFPRAARASRAGSLRIAVVALVLGTVGRAHAQAAPPADREDTAFDLMNLLAAHGLHDIDDERWNLYGQFT